ncbi:MAG: ion transporter [Synechococcaceae cyanobacterium]|nr:ion transporter [Synechococcaceae cyanobacterium]
MPGPLGLALVPPAGAGGAPSIPWGSADLRSVLQRALAASPVPLEAALALAGLLSLALLLRARLGQEALQRTILEAGTPAGRWFDRLLLVAIAASVGAVLLESEPSLRQAHAAGFRALEWAFTLLFSFEYLLRLLSAARPLRYVVSGFGLIDLAGIVPTFLELLLSGSQVYLVLRVLRVLRLLRLFRVLQLGSYQQESDLLWRVLLASRRKITVFLLVMVTLVVVIGALMYVIEAGNQGFRSIPVGIYWAVVTITTVGYGDVAPVTDLGRLMASVVMLLGYSIIAVPSGILGAALSEARRQEDPAAAARSAGLAAARPSPEPAAAAAPATALPGTAVVGTGGGAVLLRCRGCGGGDHAADAQHCKHCGARL